MTTSPDRGRVPRAILLLVAASWAVRGLVIAVSPIYGFDERYGVEAAKYPVAWRFVSAMSMPERWREIRRLSTGDRPLWTLAHLLFGSLLPSDGSAAFLLTLLASAVALLALAGAARRLGGSRHAAAVLAAVSLSPLALHYSTSVLAPPISAMWICLAIFALSSRRWAAWEWLAGGLCLGLAFGTHMGAGAPISGSARPWRSQRSRRCDRRCSPRARGCGGSSRARSPARPEHSRPCCSSSGGPGFRATPTSAGCGTTKT